MLRVILRGVAAPIRGAFSQRIRLDEGRHRQFYNNLGREMATKQFITLAVSVLALWLGPFMPAAAQPRLVVVFVVDQMRASYLDEFADDYHAGFGRLREQGAVFVNAFHDHALTETSPGHATIVTGVYPSHHGVIGNDIWNRQTHELSGVVFDDHSKMVGAERRSGRSPYRLLRSAVGDWLKQQSPTSRVFGIAAKDRAAVFGAGLHPDGAYWYDERSGHYVTSDYYRSELPSWLVDFNAAAPADAYFGTTWSKLLADDHYGYRDPSRAATVAKHSYSEFPHQLVGESQMPDRRYYTTLRTTPFIDELTLSLAESLIEAEQMGTDSSPDLLLIGLSASDYIGHRYGPWSDEVHDHYARLDGYIGKFLEYLDGRIGRGDYAVVLTADHGGMPLPERVVEQGGAAGRMHWNDLLAYIEPVVADAQRRGVIASLPTLRYEFGIIFDFGEAAVTQEQSDALAALVAAKLEQHPFITAALTHKRLRETEDGDATWLGLFQRSFFAERSADVVLYLKENHLVTDQAGAMHVSPYDYDRHVPLIFWGDGIAAREHSEAVRSVDIAPTVAALLGITAPAGLDGSDLGSELRSKE